MSSIIVRDAVLEDLLTLLNYEQEIITWERPFDVTLAPDPISYYNIKELILNPEAAVKVAICDKRIVGCGYAIEKEAQPYLAHKTYAYLGMMYTHEDYRGKGVSALIINSLKDWATTKNLKEIRLTVYDKNPSAIRAYEKVGFKKHIVEMRLGVD